MIGIKWLLVALSCVGLWLSASATGFFFAVDRSIANTEFVSRWLARQDLKAVAASAEGARKGKFSTEAALLSGAGMSLIEPEIKKQAKPMLDPFYEFLKGKSNEPKLALDLNPLQQNEKLPNEFDFLKVFRIKTADLGHMRRGVEKFYRYYHAAAGFGLFFSVLICFLLRDKRKILLTLGITLFIAGLVLFIPYLSLEMLAAKLFSRYKGVAPDVVKTLTFSLVQDFFGVYVLSPVILSLSGLGGIVAGVFVFKKKV